LANVVSNRVHDIRSNAMVGRAWEDEVYRELQAEFPDGLYAIVRNKGLRNAKGEVIRINGSYVRPDFQVINRASGRIVAVVEAKAGLKTYLSGVGQQVLIRYQRFIDELGNPSLGTKAYPPDDLPELRPRYQERPQGPSAIEGLGRALNILMMASVAIDAWNAAQYQQDLEWYEQYDPDYYWQLMDYSFCGAPECNG
jgi:hypothetical protein